ncbi:MAG TPA: hypothetical protein VJV03_13475 [Pyrinomonadaceae bacterium]|nr:hypothetical protein [Pyrinomonadaceae bacterium]
MALPQKSTSPSFVLFPLFSGIRGVIVTIAYVHPESAQRLAPEASRQAQLEVRRETPEPEHWATYVVIGVS